MRTKVLVIGIVRKDNSILMRKKPEGSLPYKETWYLFGGGLTSEVSPEDTIISEVRSKAGIDVVVSERLAWDSEVKVDLDGEEKLFIYLDVVCKYVSGDLKLGSGVEKLEWISEEKLNDYDIVPPSRKLFKKLGYIK